MKYIKYLSLYAFIVATVTGVVLIGNNSYTMGFINIGAGLLNYGFYIHRDSKKESE
jgi:hypothetical protein